MNTKIKDKISNEDSQLLPTPCYVQPFIRLYNGDGVCGLSSIETGTVKCVLTDPPYLYLKHKLDKEFNEDIFFAECKRILKEDGFVILFGRGKSFYRWNTKLAELGFEFKEEIIWNKVYASSPLLGFARKHETISIHTKKTGVLNSIKIPYTQKKRYDLNSVLNDINRLKSIFNNKVDFDAVIKFIETGETTTEESDRVNLTTVSSKIKQDNRCISVIKAIQNGQNAHSIIDVATERFTAIHPTQKPIELLEILIKMTSHKSDLIIDCFAGSCSTGIAASQLEREFIGWEIDEEYYLKAVERIKSNVVQMGLF